MSHNEVMDLGLDKMPDGLEAKKTRLSEHRPASQGEVQWLQEDTGDHLNRLLRFLSDCDAWQPFRQLCVWLEWGSGICVLHSPGELLHQGMWYLLEQGDAGSIAWICGEPDDSFDDLSLALQEHPGLRYLLVDRAEQFSYILGAGDFLQKIYP